MSKLTPTEIDRILTIVESILNKTTPKDKIEENLNEAFRLNRLRMNEDLVTYRKILYLLDNTYPNDYKQEKQFLGSKIDSTIRELDGMN